MTNARSAKSRRQSLRPKEILLPFFALMVLVAAAEIVLRVRHIPAYLMPLPSQVLRAVYGQWTEIWPDLLVTTGEALAGFVGGTGAAVFSALIFTHSRFTQRALLPLVVILQTIPVIVLTPMLTILLGNGMAPKAVVAGLICYFPTLINMVRGLQSPSPILLDLFHLLRASRLQILLKLRLPSSLPFLFASIKIATANCFVGALVAEWISADRGVGYLMQIKMFQLETATLYAAVLTTSLAALLLFGLVSVLEHWLVPWAVRQNGEYTA